MAADVNAIIMGHDGELDKYEVIGWIKRETLAAKAKAPAMTPGLFRAMFGKAA